MHPEGFPLAHTNSLVSTALILSGLPAMPVPNACLNSSKVGSHTKEFPGCQGRGGVAQMPSYLGLREVPLAGQLSALTAHHVLAALELHLQAVPLLGREGRTGPLGPVQVQAPGQDNFPDGPLGICRSNERRQVSALVKELGHQQAP